MLQDYYFILSFALFPKKKKKGFVYWQCKPSLLHLYIMQPYHYWSFHLIFLFSAFDPPWQTWTCTQGYYLCSCLFRPADLPHLYCLSDTSHSAFQHWVFHHKTGPNRYLRDSELFLLMMCHEMFVCDMHEYRGTWFMVKGPFEMKVAHWCHFVKAAADVEICVGILCV